MSTALLRRALPPCATAGNLSTTSFSHSSAVSSSSNPDDEDAVSTALSVINNQRSKTRWSNLRYLFPNGFTPSQIIQIVRTIWHKPRLAHSFFNFANRHSLSSPLPLQCYAPIIHIVARAHFRTWALTLIKEALRTSKLVGSDDHGLIPAKDVKTPKLFKELVDTYRVCNSSPLVFALLIEGLIDVNKLDPCIEIVRLLMCCGFSPHVKTCNRLISTALSQKGCDFVYDLYREIFGFNHADDEGDGGNVKERVSHKLVPNVCTINELMAAFHRNGSVDMVEELWIEMAKLNLTPNVSSYGILMAAYCTGGAMEKARNVWEDLREKGLRPDVGAYNTLIGGYCRMGEIEKAEELYRQMGLEGLNGTVVTSQHLINGYCLRGDADSALLVYKDMRVRGFNPSDATLNTMVRVLCDRKSILEAFDFFKPLTRNAGFEATGSSFQMLIKGLCGKGKMDEALQLQAQMVGKGFKPNSHIYGAFIDGYIKLGKPDMAERLREEMIAKSDLVRPGPRSS